MLRRFLLPLGLMLSYSVFHEVLWTHEPIQTIKALLSNSQIIAFVQALTNQASNEAITLFNIDLVFLSLAIGFISAFLIIELLGFLVRAYDQALPLSLLIERSLNSQGLTLSVKQATAISFFIHIAVILASILIIKNILQMAGTPYHGEFASWGSELIYYWNLLLRYSYI